MLQYTVDRRVEAVLLTLILFSIVTFMFLRPQNCNELEIINELLLNKSSIYERQRTPQVAAHDTGDGDFARFLLSEAHLIQKSIDQMTDAEMLQYLHWSDRAACYRSYDFVGVHVINNSTTGIDGQKAVCMDRGVRPIPGKCLVYSFGIVKDWSFDVLMEKYGCEVYAMDEKGWKSRTITTIYEVLLNNIFFFFTIKKNNSSSIQKCYKVVTNFDSSFILFYLADVETPTQRHACRHTESGHRRRRI
jgi:hypothetical protein